MASIVNRAPRGVARRLRDSFPPLVSMFETLSTSLWLLPMIGMVAAIAGSIGLEAVDERLSPDATAWYLFRGGPDGARELLSAIASSLMTFTGVVFSVTVLVLQLASSQFSPRVLRTFLSDRGTQGTLAVFIGTFVYALLTLRTVRGATEGVEEFVPSLSVWCAVVLATVCVATFVYFIHHVAQSIRAVNVLARIADETRASLDRLFPDGVGDDSGVIDQKAYPTGEPSLLVLHRGASGVVMAVAEERIWTLASDADVAISLVPMIGDFVAEGGVLFEVRGDAERLDCDALAATVTTGRERTLSQDPAFGFRGIVDVAERALSPGVNDPSTAVQAIDQLHDLLRRLATRRFPGAARLDAAGSVRVLLPRPDFDAYVRLALDEIRHYGEGSIQVSRRLRLLLQDLLQVTPSGRSAELRRQLHALDAAAADARGLAASPATVRRPSAQGHGP